MAEMEKLTLSIAEAAKCLGISKNSCYQAARRGELPVIKLGSRLLVSKRRLESLVNGGQQAGQQ
ncbi:MAG: helix-turn-helix domain-containing protein [Chloroflexi bacterium]|nr:helix-turn-helix domain-containing protein [Chloroflexota bacterium]